MANIVKEIENIRDAQLGEEVRGSIISGIEKINLETENTTELVETKIEELDASESTRQSNETTRQSQEAVRQANTNQAITDVREVEADVLTKLENGDFIGKTPNSEWNGTSLRFEQGDGSMGPWSNLQGPKGETGSIENAQASDITTTDGTNVQQNLDRLRDACPFPVNGIYLSMSNANPATIWANTTWEQVSQGRMLIGAGSFTDKNNETRTFTAGAAATGEYSHKLTVDELPSHDHKGLRTSAGALTYSSGGYGINIATKGTGTGNGNNANDIYTTTTGNGKSHNTLNPEFVLFIYQRLTQELPSHTHKWRGYLGNKTVSNGTYDILINGNEPVGSTTSTGNDLPHNNVGPEFAINVFKRIN